MTIQVHQVQQNSDTWLKLREGKVTGSIADLLLKWGKKEAMLRNRTDEEVHNFYIDRGHILEDEAIELYEAIHKRTVERPGLVTNSRYPDASCSPDGICNKFLIEVKCFAYKNHIVIKDEASIPPKIMAQLQFNMLICGLRKARLILYNPDIDDPMVAYREIFVLKNEKIHANIKRKLKS
jgi:hypothetical protein